MLFILLVMVLVVGFTRCFRGRSFGDPRGENYAGSEQCARCHQSISNSFAHTAHFLSTRVANATDVSGSFSTGSSEIKIDESTRIVMEKKESGLYQTLYVNNKPKESHRFDLVMGAMKGQTYLYKKGDSFFQLPVSYFSALHEWTASPGYSFSHLDFNRPVAEECFGCHSSFVEKNQSAIYPIDCERCHGPGAAHVQFHDEHPETKQAKFMVSFLSLTRAQKIDLCAVCHSGTKHILLRSTFGFKMGDSLTSFLVPLYTGDQLDVHGNQAQLLSQSKCFRMSLMDCTTCHDAHQNQRDMIQSFNDRCQGCHNSAGEHTCKIMTPSNQSFIQNNCTDCHMPAQSSKSITVLVAGQTMAVANRVVNHRIAVYPEESAAFLKRNNLK
jgi:hypothetical protein